MLVVRSLDPFVLTQAAAATWPETKVADESIGCHGFATARKHVWHLTLTGFEPCSCAIAGRGHGRWEVSHVPSPGLETPHHGFLSLPHLSHSVSFDPSLSLKPRICTFSSSVFSHSIINDSIKKNHLPLPNLGRSNPSGLFWLTNTGPKA